MSKALLVDVGGTNIRYAIANNLDEDISDINKSSFNEKNFENLLQKLIKDNNIDTLIISIAGPKINNSITMTNRNYTFNSDKIKSKFNLQKWNFNFFRFFAYKLYSVFKLFFSIWRCRDIN